MTFLGDIAEQAKDVPEAVSKRQSLSVVVPVFNEQGSVGDLFARLIGVLNTLDLDWTIIFVDDGSTDGTLAKIKQLHAQDARVAALSFSRNFGKESAVAAGLHYATGDAAVLMDGDLQHPPEILMQFVEFWRKGYDIVYGVRQDRRTASAIGDGFALGFYKIFRSLSGMSLPEGAGDFRLLSRAAINALNQLGERARFNKGLFAWIGYKTASVPYTPSPRLHDDPKWKFTQLANFAVDGITAFSTIPLRVWSYLGLAISLFALLYAAFFLLSTLLFGADLPGFPSLIISIMLLSGVQLISLGVLGEYLGRVYEEVKARPLYLVAEEVGIARGRTDNSLPNSTPSKANAD